MRYLLIVFLLTVFVIGLVWQNLEVVKIKMEYKKLCGTVDELYRSRDLLLYNIELHKSIDKVQGKARAKGYAEINQRNLVVINTDEAGGENDK